MGHSTTIQAETEMTKNEVYFTDHSELGIGSINEYLRCETCGAELYTGHYDRTDGDGDYIKDCTPEEYNQFVAKHEAGDHDWEEEQNENS